MIITETVTINNRMFIHTYSDEGKYVVRDGVAYEDAMDPAEFNRTYTEGELILIEEPETDILESEFAEAGRILMGYEHS